MASCGIRPTGIADLYTHFVLATHKFLAPQAVSAWVLPTKFLRHSSGRALRSYLSQHVRLHRIHAYDAGAFDVTRLDETIDEWSVVIFTNQPPQPSDAFEFSIGGQLLDPHETTQLTYESLTAEKLAQLADLDERCHEAFYVGDFSLFAAAGTCQLPSFHPAKPARGPWASAHAHVPLLPPPDHRIGISVDEWDGLPVRTRRRDRA